MHMRTVLRLTVLAGLMVLFGAAEDGVVFGIGSAQARIGRPLTPMSYAGLAGADNIVIQRCIGAWPDCFGLP
jgi:hypothetical protein